MKHRLTALLALCVALLAAPTEAQTITEPILRIEVGMHTGPIRRIAVTADGSMMATGSYDKTVRLWSLPDAKLIRVLRPPIGDDNDGKVHAIAMDPAGRWVASGGWDAAWSSEKRAYVSIFDAATGAIIKRVGPFAQTISALAVSPDGKRLAIGLDGDGGITVRETASWTELYKDEQKSGVVRRLAFAPDGRLFLTNSESNIQSYAANGRRLVVMKALGGKEPNRISVTPDGTRLAIGHQDSLRVDVLDTSTLALLYSADTSGLTRGDLSIVAWIDNGTRLVTTGGHWDGGQYPLFVWQDAGRGARSTIGGARDSIHDLAALPNGQLAFGTAEPSFGVIDGTRRKIQTSSNADLRGKRNEHFTASPDGRKLRFGLLESSAAPVMLDLAGPSVTPAWTAEAGLNQADTRSLDIKNWWTSGPTTLNGKPLTMTAFERPRSLAILPGSKSFILGSEWRLRHFDQTGKILWNRAAPAVVWGINTALEGRVAIVALGDGTIRWHRTSDGKELLAAFIHVDRSNNSAAAKGWVIWTPKGYYNASPGSEDIIGWHINNGLTKAADFFPASRLRSKFYRPDIVARVLEDLDEDKAVQAANAAGTRTKDEDVRSSLPPIVEILSPADNSAFSAETMKIEFSVRSPSGQPIEKIEVLIDGRPIDISRGLARPDDAASPKATNKQPSTKQSASKQAAQPGSQSADTVTTRSIVIPTPKRDFDLAILGRTARATGEASRRRLVYALNQRTAQPAATPVIAAPSDALKPKLYALIVGVSAYDRAGMALQFAHKDAQDFAATLQRQKGGLYRDVEVKLITDKAATAEAIRGGFGWLEKEVTARDIAVVFLAGHGVTDLQQRFWYLPVNADPENNLRGTAIPKSDFDEVLRAIPGKVLMFIDACHAGKGIEKTRFATRGAGQSANSSAVDITMLVNELTSTENGVVMFASSTGRQLSQESPDWQNGAFTKAVVEGLAGKADYNKDGAVSIKELDLYVSERVKELTRGSQSPVARKPETIPDYPIAVIR